MRLLEKCGWLFLTAGESGGSMYKSFKINFEVTWRGCERGVLATYVRQSFFGPRPKSQSLCILLQCSSEIVTFHVSFLECNKTVNMITRW